MSGTRASVFRGSRDDTRQTACSSASTTTTDLPRNFDEEEMEFVADWNNSGGDRAALYGPESASTRQIASIVSPSSGGDRAQPTTSMSEVTGPISSRENKNRGDEDEVGTQRGFSGTCYLSHVTAVDVLPVEEQQPTPNTLWVGACHTALEDEVKLRRSNKLVTWGSGHHRAPSVGMNDSSLRRHETSTEEARPSKSVVRRHTSPDEMTKDRQNLATAAAVQAVSPGRTKRKATRVLGVMFVVFVVLWTPFFVLNLLSAACPGCVRSVDPRVWTVLVWLGWISSLANPIIYTSFSPAFRAAFRRLLTCQGRRDLSTAKRRQQQWTHLIRCRHPSLSSN